MKVCLSKTGIYLDVLLSPRYYYMRQYVDADTREGGVGGGGGECIFRLSSAVK